MAEEPEVSNGILSNELLVKVWEKAVDTQMHFNEMSVKSRQLGLAFVAAALALSVVIFNRTDKHYYWAFQFCDRPWELHVSVLIILFSAAAMYGVRLLDLGVYQKMLRGAVTFGEDLEEQHLKSRLGLQKGMTQAISHFSRYANASVDRDSKPYTYQEGGFKNAGTKISQFYWTVIGFLLFSAIALFAINNLSLNSNPAPL